MVLGIFLNMVIYLKMARKFQKNHRKLEDVLTGDDDVR
jgi:hypothetical protein